MLSDQQSLLNLDNKVGLVTGGGGGIGLGIAKRLHQSGANMVLVDLHQDNVLAAADELNNIRSNSAYAIHADVSNEMDVRRTVDESITEFGQIDILVNNAGVFPVKPVLEMTYDQFDNVLKTNLHSVYMFTKMIAETMVQRGDGGKIINITSIDALHPSMVGLAHYDASKHGVWGFTKNVAIELAPHKIWVNAIAPGGVATPGVLAMQGPASDDPEAMAKIQEAFLNRIPMHRMGDPDDIAKVALFLASDMSSYMTGSQIIVDGGALLM